MRGLRLCTGTSRTAGHSKTGLIQFTDQSFAIDIRQGKIAGIGQTRRILAEHNRALLARRGTVIYLQLPPEMLLQRLAGDRKRPLLQTPDRAGRLQMLSEQRTPIYRQCADITLDLDRIPLSQVRHRILEAVRHYRTDAQTRAGHA